MDVSWTSLEEGVPPGVGYMLVFVSSVGVLVSSFAVAYSCASASSFFTSRVLGEIMPK